MSPPTVFSIRELAARIGVSKSTVSLALRNDPRIAEATRKRVQEQAEKLGYAPSALVTALMTQVRSQHVQHIGEALAFLTAYGDKDAWRQLTTLQNCFDEAEAQAKRAGFRLEPFWMGPGGVHSKRVARMLKARGVRGAIIAPLPHDALPLELDWGEGMVVTTGFSFRQHAIHRAVHNHFAGTLTCYENLVRLGYRRIGFCMHKESDDRVKHLWMAGYLTAQQVHRSPCLPLLLLEGAVCQPGDDERFQTWFEAHRPDAIIGIYPDYPLHWLGNASTAPQVAYASLDLSRNQVGTIAGIKQDWESIGAAAVDMLVGGLYRNNRGIPSKAKLVLIEGEWKDGLSAQPRPNKNPA